MKKIDETVRKETVYIALVTLILSMLMQSVFLIIHRWNYTVLLGNLLGFAAGVLNFFLMGLTVQKAVLLDEEAAKNKVQISQMLRMVMLIAFAVIAGVVKCFNLAAFVITLLFPRIAVFFRPYINKKNDDNK